MALRKRSSLVLALTLATLLGAGMAHAGDAPAETVEHEASWAVTKAGAPAATESLKAVLSPTKTRFATFTVKPAAKGGVKLIGHLQRDPEGTLQKYRRLEDKRKGEGVFAFLRGEGVRIVGINSARKPADLAGVAGHAVWDARVWSTLWHWVARLDASKATVTVPFLDVDKGTTGSATATRGEPRPARTAKGETATVQAWTIDGLGPQLTVWVGPKGRLIGVKGGDRELMMVGWGWDLPSVAEPVDGEQGEGGASPEGEGGDGEDQGVGP